MTCVTQTQQEKGFIIHSFIHSFNSTRFNEHFCVSGMILGTSDEQLDNGPSLGVNISTRNKKQTSKPTHSLQGTAGFQQAVCNNWHQDFFQQLQAIRVFRAYTLKRWFKFWHLLKNTFLDPAPGDYDSVIFT